VAAAVLPQLAQAMLAPGLKGGDQQMGSIISLLPLPLILLLALLLVSTPTPEQGPKPLHLARAAF